MHGVGSFMEYAEKFLRKAIYFRLIINIDDLFLTRELIL